MRVRTTIISALGIALVASATAAQEPSRKTTTSDKRILVSKGEVALPRVDTIYVTRLDTVYVTRYDTRTVTRVDTVTVTEPAPIPIIPPKGELYWGLYTGATGPSGNIDRLYTNGFHLGTVLGWEDASSFLGFRLNGDVAQIGRERGFNSTLVGEKTPLMITLGGDLKVMPFNTRNFRVYGIGGMNFNTYQGIATVSKAGTGICNADGKFGCYQPATSGWNSEIGFNAGGGTDFTIAGQELFLEARAMAIQAHGARTWYIPVSFGLRYF